MTCCRRSCAAIWIFDVPARRVFRRVFCFLRQKLQRKELIDDHLVSPMAHGLCAAAFPAGRNRQSGGKVVPVGFHPAYGTASLPNSWV